MTEIILYGTVGMEWSDEAHFTAADVRVQLASATGPITVRLNSGGGNAPEGQAIYTLLRDYPGEVTVMIDSVAASAASLIAMAGDRIVMRRGSWMLIHDPAMMWTDGRGTQADHEQVAAALSVIGDAYAEVYAARAGMTREEARRLMRAETVMDGATAVDLGFADETEDMQALEPAAFDYRLYRNAPAGARRVAERLGSPVTAMAAVAMFLGRRPDHAQEPVMQDDQTPAVGADADAIDDAAPQTETITPADDHPAPAPAPVATTARPQIPAAVAAERERARAITETAMLANLPQMAASLIAENITADQARARLLAHRQETDMSTGQNRQAPAPARVLRDERDTRRTGMSAALVAQITGAAPAAGSEAEPYMSLTIAEMAAQCAGLEGRLRRPGDRDHALRMAAGHTSGDFPLILENALNRIMLERYEAAPVTYRAIARQRSFNDFRPHKMLRAGDFPTLQQIDPADGEIKFGTLGEARETVSIKSYATGIRLSREMLVNDDMGLIQDVIGDIGSMVADFEETTFYTYFEAATLADGNSVWHSSRNNIDGSGAAISVTSLGVGRAAMRKQTSVDSRLINLSPSILLVAPEEETEAQQIVATIQPLEAGKVNPFSGTLQVVTSAQLTAQVWYLMADPARAGGACFVYGYLNGAAAPRIRMDEPFGQQGIAYTVEHDFGVGAIDYRGTYKNIGA